MLGTLINKHLPDKNVVVKPISKPIAIPIKRDYAFNNSSNSAYVSNTPPNSFVEHLQTRMALFSSTPVFVYNSRS